MMEKLLLKPADAFVVFTVRREDFHTAKRALEADTYCVGHGARFDRLSGRWDEIEIACDFADVTTVIHNALLILREEGIEVDSQVSIRTYLATDEDSSE